MRMYVIAFCLAAFAIGGVGMYAAQHKVDAQRRRERWIKFATYFVILNTVLVSAACGPVVFTLLMFALVATGVHELSGVLKGGSRVAIWTGYLLLACGLLTFSVLAKPEQAMFIYLLVALFDGFSQVFGQLYGRHALAPKISPAKSVEGMLGGVVAASLGAILLRPLMNATPARALLICGVVVAAALCGDLAASWVKRRSGAKDFGRLLPGHGGVLDHFDSFLLAAPVSILFLNG